MINRRQFLKLSGAGLGVATGFASNLASFNAYGADSTGYKALVCVFFRGGKDTHDMVIPYDLSSSASFESIRAALIDEYAASGYTSRRRDSLLPLESSSAMSSAGGTGDGRTFALPQEMQALHSLYQNQKLAIVGNVGPLVEPTNSASYANGSSYIPPRLFSHNDQQSVWMASSPEGATSGWGGRFGDVMQAASANQNASFTSVTTAGTMVFANGLTAGGFHLSGSGGGVIQEIGGSSPFSLAYTNNASGDPLHHRSLIAQDLVNVTGSAVENNALLRSIFSSTPDPVTVFPSSKLGDQLSWVAKMVASRDALGMRRQVFIVADNGYDHHSLQPELMPVRRAEISEAMAAFYNEMAALGIEDDVTQFTASDFGRSLVPNSNGSDHGWGSHHMVLGGAVNGGRFYGNVPEAAVGHNQDAGRGRLIPELSVDQYAFSLARWFGLSHSEALDVLPSIQNIDHMSLSGMLPWS